MNDLKNFKTGNVVKWSSSLWIVKGFLENDEGRYGMELICFSHSSLTAYPTRDWPINENNRVDSVKYIADNAGEIITTLYKKLTRELCEIGIIND